MKSLIKTSDSGVKGCNTQHSHSIQVHGAGSEYDSTSAVREPQSSQTYSQQTVGHVARMGEKRGAYRILVGRPERRRPLWRLKRRREDNIKMDLQEVGWGHGLD
jgi:hypothetical protein